MDAPPGAGWAVGVGAACEEEGGGSRDAIPAPDTGSVRIAGVIPGGGIKEGVADGSTKAVSGSESERPCGDWEGWEGWEGCPGCAVCAGDAGCGDFTCLNIKL